MESIKLVVYEDPKLPKNTIVVSEKVYEQINQEKAKLIRNPLISFHSVDMVNIEKSNEILDDYCKISIDIASRLGVDFGGDTISINKV